MILNITMVTDEYLRNSEPTSSPWAFSKILNFKFNQMFEYH